VKLWASVALIAAVVAAGVWALWNFELRWRPKTITRHQAEIAALLQQAGWVAPGLPGKKLYMIAYRDCPGCQRYKQQEFPKLHDDKVDTRVVLIARRDENGMLRSTPVERATVAQLWMTRDWRLMQAWDAAAPNSWRPPVPQADGDIARTAVVEAGRSLVDRLAPMLEANDLEMGYPLLVWWNDKGEMRACACQAPQSYRFVRRELGA
jgi:hypothetical protein